MIMVAVCVVGSPDTATCADCIGGCAVESVRR